MTSPVPEAIRVLLVDDSAVVRGVFGRVIDAEPDLRVAQTAGNGRQALDVLARHPVDVVILDIEMPVMDGLTALPLILAAHPHVRVIMASSLTQEGAKTTMQALAAGAADFVHKPTTKGGTTAATETGAELVRKIRALGNAARRALGAPSAPAVATPTFVPTVATRSRPVAIAPANDGDFTPRLLAIASSTGGPNALAEVLSALPTDFPLPTVITQHMPPLFTKMLAERLQKDARRPCREAVDGEAIEAGVIYLAPGDRHLVLKPSEGQVITTLSSAPAENFCRPAADPMLRSSVRAFGGDVLLVVLTGMGEDGMRGAREVQSAGGRVIVQDEATSVVWGMPGAVVRAGIPAEQLPLSEIAGQIATRCMVSR
ncbi:MAG: chemotaxis response regulator protein-glutamate methylesterase [Gemmatimonadaceae bacterium]|nr:chemotaxis response regulator protein-glutamate methylesterase [Gemmatimonadaceae bacterium]